MVEHRLVPEYLQVLHDNTEASYQKSGFSHERPIYEARAGKKYTKIVVRHSAMSNFQESAHSFVDAAGNVYKAAGWRAPAPGVRYRLEQDMETLKVRVEPYGSYLYKDAAEYFLQLADEPKDFDERGNRIHFRSDDGLEYWTEYDANNNEIHFRSHDISRGLGNEGEEWWKEYDANNNVIHYRTSDGVEWWKEYDTNNNLIHCRYSDGDEMWREYDANNNEIHCRYSDGVEWWKEYDANNNLIHRRTSTGVERWYDENGNSIEAPPTPTQEHTMQIENTFTLIADYPGHAELTLSIPADCTATDFLRHCETLVVGMGFHHNNWDDAILELAEEIRHMKKTA